MRDIILTNLNLKKIGWIIKRRLYIPIIFTCFFGCIGYLFGKYTISYYYNTSISFYVYSDSKYVIYNYNLQDITMTKSDLIMSRRLVPGYMEAINSDYIISKVIKNSDLDMSVEKVRSMMFNSMIDGTSIFYTYFTGDNQEDVYKTAKLFAENAPTYIMNMVRLGGIEVIDYPIKPENPYIVNNTNKFTLLAGILGCGLSLFFIICFGLLDPIIRTSDELEYVTKKRVLAIIPWIKIDTSKNYNSVLYDTMNTHVKEAYRKLKLALLFASEAKPCSIYAIIGTDSKCGKSLTCINLALSLASSNKKVLIYDCNFKNPSIKKILNIDPNFTSSMNQTNNQNDIEASIYHYNDKLDVFYNDYSSVNDESIFTHNCYTSIKILSDNYDYILIDTVEIKHNTNIIMFNKFVDGFIMVAKYGLSHMDDEQTSLQLFNGKSDKIIGYVINATMS